MSERAPRRVRFAVGHFDLGSARVLDVGCGRGEHLAHFGPGSVGLELDPAAVAVGRQRGLDIRRWNFQDGIPQDLKGSFDAAWCSNFLEHVLRPHEFLIELGATVVPRGLICVVVPLSRPLRMGAWKGFLAADHVNFFTRRTLRLTLERAGLEVRTIVSPSFPALPLAVARALGAVAPNVIAVATPIAGFDYPAKAHKTLSHDGISFK